MIKKVINFFYRYCTKMGRLGYSLPDISGYVNPFLDIEVMHKGESIFKDSLAAIVYCHLKDYFQADLNKAKDLSQIEITVTLPTGSCMKIPLTVKNLDEKGYRQRGDGLPKT